MKKLSATLVLLLFSMILLPVFVGLVNANSSFYAWGALYNSPPSDEYQYDLNICRNVTSWMPGTWTTANNYEANTYPNNVISVLSNTENNGIYDHTLWVGDFCPQIDYDGSQHWSFCSGGSHRGQYTWDSAIYSVVGPSTYQMSEFIWTCSCGGLYFNQQYPVTPHYATSHDSPYIWYGWYDGTTNKAIGMPYAWSGTQSLQTDGYVNYNNNDPTTYIGWENASPNLKDSAHNGSLANYWFLYYYFYYALGKVDGQYHNSHQSLDYAASRVYGQTFGSSPYWYGWLNNQAQWTRMRAMGNQGAP